MRTIATILAVMLTITPASGATPVLNWCGEGHSVFTCDSGLELRFKDKVVHYVIAPDVPYRKQIREAIEEQAGKISSMFIVFDGYKKTGSDYNGVQINRYSGQILPINALAFTVHADVVEHDDYAETVRAICNLRKPSFTNAKKAVIIASHEFFHALGLAHSEDEESLMYGSFGKTRTELLEDDIATLDTLYDEVKDD